MAHDSHNVIAVGADDTDPCRAVNLVVENRGGLAVVCGTERETLQLPIAGLMADTDGWCRKSARLQGIAGGSVPHGFPFMFTPVHGPAGDPAFEERPGLLRLRIGSPSPL